MRGRELQKIINTLLFTTPSDHLFPCLLITTRLFAPGLLFLLLLAHGVWETIPRLAVCAAVQLVLGLPFLLENPLGYMERAFNFGRQFDYTWTVNWRLISKEVFLDRRLHLALLALHVTVATLFWMRRWTVREIPLPFRGGSLVAHFVVFYTCLLDCSLIELNTFLLDYSFEL